MSAALPSRAPAAWATFCRTFPVLLPLPLLWGHMDAFQHMNNVAYFRLWESARMLHMTELTSALPPSSSLDVPAFHSGTSSAGPILAATSCRFRIPLTYPDTLCVGSSVDLASLGPPREERFSCSYAVFSLQHLSVAAEGSGDIVLYNYQKGQRAEGMPPELRSAITAVQARAAARSEQDIERLFRDLQQHKAALA